MTSLPQTHQCASPAQDGRRRTSPPAASGTPETFANPRGRARQSLLPTVDASLAFGCVDWFLYPDPKPAPEVRRIPS
jgi:hypothetical protein